MTSNPDTAPDMWVSSMAVFLNHWYSDYAEARAHREAEGGYLLLHRSQYFVTVAEAVRDLGLDPQDPDWARIGWDWRARLTPPHGSACGPSGSLRREQTSKWHAKGVSHDQA
jgi:hypothetical protein